MVNVGASAVYIYVRSVEEPISDMSGHLDQDNDAHFESFLHTVEPPLRRALVATYGYDMGRTATAEALAWAWEHRDRLPDLKAPVPYLYRVGQTRTRRRLVRVLHARPDWPEVWVEPELATALQELSGRQRVAVVLIHGFDWSVGEVAQVLGIKPTTVRNHLNRGLRRLRARLEGSPWA